MLDPTLLHARAMRENSRADDEHTADPLRAARGVFHGLIASLALAIVVALLIWWSL